MLNAKTQDVLSTADKPTLYAAYVALAEAANAKAKAISSFSSKGEVFAALKALLEKADATITALLSKTVEAGATEGEEKAAYMKAKELILKYAAHGLDADRYTIPPAVAARLSPKPATPKADAPKADAPKKSSRIIRVACEELLLKVTGKDKNGRSEGLPYEDILAAVRQEFPNAKTTVACLRWYAVQLRERGEMVPNRPRAESKKAA
jgi:hypothetical protein